MRLLFGPISARLRAVFGPNVAEWPAYRESEEIDDMPATSYDGVQLGRHWRGEPDQEES